MFCLVFCILNICIFDFTQNLWYNERKLMQHTMDKNFASATIVTQLFLKELKIFALFHAFAEIFDSVVAARDANTAEA